VTPVFMRCRRVGQHGCGVCGWRQLHWATETTVTPHTWLGRGDH